MRPEDVANALRRYPGIEIFLAFDFFRSDRRHAGLGALRPERGARELYRTKRHDFASDNVFWHQGVDRPRRREYERVSLTDFLASMDSPNSATYSARVIEVPAAKFRVTTVAPLAALSDPKHRSEIARDLWAARRQLAAAIKEAP